MFFNNLHKELPKCKNCIYYVHDILNNKNQLGKCKKFGNPYIYAEHARMDDLKCSIYGLKFKKKFNIS